MASHGLLPDDTVLVRTTDEFSQETVPSGLLRDHKVADGVWGRLVVRSGSLGFVFQDSADNAVELTAGDSIVIPPGRLHHVVPHGPVRFVVEFHRPSGD